MKKLIYMTSVVLTGIVFPSFSNAEPRILTDEYSLGVYAENVKETDHLSFDKKGNLYTGRENYVTAGDMSINKVSSDGKTVESFGPRIPDPDAVIVDTNGYISTYGPGSILVAGVPGNITQISEDGSQSSVLFSSTGDDIKNPQQMKFDSAGRLIYGNCFSKSVGVVSGGSTRVLKYLNHKSCPTGIALDSNDNIYVTDHFGGNVIKLMPDGTMDQ